MANQVAIALASVNLARITRDPDRAVTRGSDSFLCYRPVTKTLSSPRDTSDKVCVVKGPLFTWNISAGRVYMP